MTYSTRPEITAWQRQMWDVFGNPMTGHGAAGFFKLHNWFIDPENKFVSRWRKAEPQWCQHFEKGVLMDANQSYAAALYHAENIIRMERLAVEMAQPIVPLIPRPGCVGVITPKIDFEYQALELASDRYFEHLTLGLNAFFKDRCHDFERFGRALRHRKSNSVAQALADVYERHRPSLEHTFSRNEDQSLRSRIMHREAVPVGCLNVHSDGRIFFAGGADNLNLPAGRNQQLTDVIMKRLAPMREYTNEILETFMIEVTAWDAAKSGGAAA